jgi:tRNA threonylcarbamoyl adenosine modification protein (Sua5/YciO/YrdC/YwlC family)
LDLSDLDVASLTLAAGRLVVIPTDTVYGVAAALTDSGVDALFRLKRRPRHKAIPVLAATRQDLNTVVRLEGPARLLGERFWPGPLTLVLPRKEGFDIDLGGVDRSSVAVRVPRHEVARELLKITGPLAVTSANESGEAPANSLDAARRALGGTVSVFVDGGPGGGLPSTVAGLRGGLRVLRAGGIVEDELRVVLKA